MSIAALGAIASLAGTAVGAVGAIQAANARADAANTQAQIDANNQKVATQNAQWAAQAGEQQAKTAGDKARLMEGAIKAGEAANGIDVNSGSASDIQKSESDAAQTSALIIRQNAAKDAYAYGNQLELRHAIGAGQAKRAGRRSGRLNRRGQYADFRSWQRR